MKQQYITKRFSSATLEIINAANEIIEEYEENDLTLTLRQLYYQFVSRDLIANTMKEYGRLGRIINDGRLAGMIDWSSIEDRTRNISNRLFYNNPGEAIQSTVRIFKLDRWKDQLYHVEVWVEKEALIGVIEDTCWNLDIGFFACKGYVSQSEMWQASQRFRRKKEQDDKIPVIIHLGDHDPSGIDMTRDILDRQKLFEGTHIVERIALNMDQINEYNPPPNPAKMSDSRSSE